MVAFVVAGEVSASIVVMVSSMVSVVGRVRVSNVCKVAAIGTGSDRFKIWVEFVEIKIFRNEILSKESKSP